MAYDPNAPQQTHNAFTDLDAIRENTNQLRKFESAASEPANLVAGVFWLDTSASPYVLKQRNAANTTWLILWTFDNLPIQTPSSGEQGDILIRDGSGWTRLAHATANQFLLSGGHGANPAWGNLPGASISQSMLNTTYGDVGGHAVHGISLNYTLPGGTYGFYPQVAAYYAPTLIVKICHNFGSETLTTNIHLENLLADTDVGGYARQRYVTASGKEHWFFAIVQKSTGKIIHSYSAPDHPCYGNGDDPMAVPHPFPDFWKNPLPEGLEIVLLEMEDTDKIKTDGARKVTDSILVDMGKDAMWKPRDMDGKNTLVQKDSSYSVKKIRTV